MTLSAGNLVRITGISRTFPDGTAALENVSLTIRDASITTLLGPSGCGKSTLLRILSGLDSADTGTLDWNTAVPKPGDLGFVFQDATLLPWANVWDNIHLPFRIAGTPSPEVNEKIRGVISLVGLEGFEGHRPDQLSGGMRMRVSIARALATSPSILLMYEPFAALDEITRFRLNDDLLRIQEAINCTIVFVTHSVYEAVYLSDQIAVMSPRPGRIFAVRDIDLGSRNSTIRSSGEFAQTCGSISALLAETEAA